MSLENVGRDVIEDQNEELDLPPEYCHYRDEGCELSASCLNCPLEKCVYDEPGGTRHLLKKERDQQIARLFTIEGKKVKELALMYGLSQRTVQRALKNSSTIPLSSLSIKRQKERIER